MAPGAGGKRRRIDRMNSGDAGNTGMRQSLHRPSNFNMAQHSGPAIPKSRDHFDMRGRRRQPNRPGHNSVNRRSNDSQSLPGPTDTPTPSLTTPAKDAAELALGGKLSPTANQPSPSPTPPAQQSAQGQLQPPLSDTYQPQHNPPPLSSYEYVSGSAVAEWASIGKLRVLEHAAEAKAEQDFHKISAIYQELIQSARYRRLPPSEAGMVVKEIIEKVFAFENDDIDEDCHLLTSPFDPRSLFLDTLSVVTDSDSSDSHVLKSLVFSTGINPALMRLQLETSLLQSLGLVRETFNRIGIRKQTNLLYRQSNYNLLREESEGYSKLITELFTTSNNEPPSREVVEDTFERVKAMIGAFDMDVGRVLDVTLDVFAAVLVKQYRFFVRFLRISSWWPKSETYNGIEGSSRDSGLPGWALPGSAGWTTTEEERAEIIESNKRRDREFWERVRATGIRAFFEIGRRTISEVERRQFILEASSVPEEDDFTRKWIEETGILPPKGNGVAAQLLGFKLRFYSSKARSRSDVLPDNLIYLAALLIKVGFISLRDLYPHLWRPDDSMDTLKEEKMKEKAERERASRPGGGMNALLSAGVLPDDTLPIPRMRDADTRSATPNKEQEKEKEKERSASAKAEEELPEPSDQKVLILKSLLVIGAIPESLYILSKFPWLMEAYPELPELIHRILHHSLGSVYSSIPHVLPISEIREQKQIPSHDQSGVAKGRVRLAAAPPRRVLRWALADKEDTNDGTDFRFYWDDWADSVPVCQSVDDVFALCSSFLNLSGHKIGQDPSLLTKLVRIGKFSLDKDDSAENKARWQDLCKRLLVPAISLTRANPGVVNEVFDLISIYPREVRYNMYAEWNFGQISRLPDIKLAFDQARAETKDVLKRLSKTNIRPMARALAKIAYANPGVVISVAVNQIESYENLIEVVVECARYFTYLGYDILTWSLINSLGQKGRSRVQGGGLLTSRWLNALSSFAGRIFKRYSVMDPTPLLQYVVNQLQNNNSTDLIVLEQLISSMAGIITDTNFNDLQIQAMAGGQTLQSQTILQLLDKRHESKTTSRRLLKSLTASKLAGQLLIAIAQERLTCIFKESDEASSELKLLGNIFDEIHRVLTQYLDLLRSSLSVDEFDSFVPDLASLIRDFGIQPEIAFWVRRPSVAQKIMDYEHARQAEDSAAKSQEEDETLVQDEDEEMESADEGEATAKEDRSVGNAMDTDKESRTKEVRVNTAVRAGQSSFTDPATTEAFADNPIVQEMEEQVKSVLPPANWGVVGSRFYVIFWQLSLYDVHIPQKAYEDEIERQKKKVIAIGYDRSDISAAGAQRKEREKKQVALVQERILEENKHHLTSYGQTRARLLKEKDRWFAGMRGKHDSLNIALLEQCLMPRLLLSPVEAFYCFKMIKLLHSSGTPNFRTVGLLDQLFRDQRLTAIIFQCTSKEADNFGRFLNEILRDLGRWHADKAVYEKEAFGAKRDSPGFAMAVDQEGKPTTFLEYEDFRRLLYKWHRLLAAALKTCLNGGEYMHIRNSISVLKAVVQHFPVVNWIGRDMLSSVNNLSQNDERDDVKTPAASLIGDLSRREKKWLLPQAFMINEPIPTDKAVATKPKSPVPQLGIPAQLNAAAPVFKPSVTKDLGAQSSGETAEKLDVEDGEIEDAKIANVARTALKPDKLTDDPSRLPTELPAPTASIAADSQAHTEAGRDLAADEGPAAGIPDTSKTHAEAEHASVVQPLSSGRSRSSSRTADRAQLSDTLDHTAAEKTLLSTSPTHPEAHLPSRPPKQADVRLPIRLDYTDSRRDRHRNLPRGGRYNDRQQGRPDQSVYETRSYDRIERKLPVRPFADDQFHGPPYHDGRTSREPSRLERIGRMRSSESFQGRAEADRSGRERPPVSLPGPPTHPDRIDLIHDRQERTGDAYRRLDKDDRRSVSNVLSPSRAELPSRPDRFPGDRRSADLLQPQPRNDDLPTGPRNERHLRVSDATGARDSMAPPDMNHGRLRPPEPLTDVPSGPRGRNLPLRGGRSMSSSQTPSQATLPANTSVERQPPTGPGRQGMRNSFERTSPTATTIAVSLINERADASGIHPDRLKAMQQQPGEDAYGGARSPLPTGPQSMIPPSGPRSAQPPSSGPSPTSRGLPSGTQSSSERGRGDKRFVGINHMLQQSVGPIDRSQGTTIRGRGAGRAMNLPSSQVTVPPTSASIAVSDGNRSAQPLQGLLDPAAGRSSGQSGNTEGAVGRSRVGRSELVSESASETRRSSRHSSGMNHTHGRERDRDHDRQRDHRGGDGEGTRSTGRRDDYRERIRDFERERSRRGEGGASANREERHETRESSRRGSGLREEARRRERRERDDGPEAGENEGRLRPPSPLSGGPPPNPQPPLPSASSAQDDRRWTGGQEVRNRDRVRDYGRKRGRTGGGDEGNDGGQVGMENKRPRRGR